MTDALLLPMRYPWYKYAEAFTPTHAFAYLLEEIYESTIPASWARRDDP
jgi:hypothetical protein